MKIAATSYESVIVRMTEANASYNSGIVKLSAVPYTTVNQAIVNVFCRFPEMALTPADVVGIIRAVWHAELDSLRTLHHLNQMAALYGQPLRRRKSKGKILFELNY
jgi:hypothetical protein